MKLTIPATHSVTINVLPETPLGKVAVPQDLAVGFTNPSPSIATASYAAGKITVLGIAPGTVKIAAKAPSTPAHAGFDAEIELDITAAGITKWSLEAEAPVLQAKYAGK